VALSLSASQRAAYRFLKHRAQDAQSFTAADIESVAGWKPGSFATYKTKHLRGFITTVGKGRFRVETRFLRVTEEQFADTVGQSRKTLARFRRAIVHAIVTYEFLLPLTNERKLREALDELFYREPLELRAKEIGRAALGKIIPDELGESDEAYIARVVDRVGSLLGGYSIGHVSGRFRAGPLLSYADAAQVVAKRGRYLVDETTAVVRFILPIAASKVVHGPDFTIAANPIAPANISTHIDTARELFIAFFVESAIIGIHGEDEIWFLESSPSGERLYVLERDAATAMKVRQHGGRQLALIEASDSLDTWLRQSGYREIADKIENIESKWRANDLKTRRNWWVVLAGDLSGNPREVAGERFPIISSIRRRQGLPPARGGLSRASERPLPPRDA
jgi:hypothetical protein